MNSIVRFSIVMAGALFLAMADGLSAAQFEGQHYRGSGDIEYLRLLEFSRRLFEPDPELQNLSMLYEPKWNGLIEGPTWDAWWIQNSYGTTYCILPFLREPFITFLQNSHDLWFDQMGDGKHVGAPPPFDWAAPDGCLCDAARPGWIVYKQGDGRTAIHDWGMEFTAAGLLMQGELLLIGRDPNAIQNYLPKLERCARFIESRRDPNKNLFLAGPAGNLLAPSYAGWHKTDGTFDKAYLAGLSITYIAALDRLIELEKLSGRTAQAAAYANARESAKNALPLLMTEEGYFIRSLDPDGVKHGIFGAAEHGYFEASPNHDAIAFHVADDTQAARIFARMESIPELRPYAFVLPNFPSYDDMYEKPEGLWAYGTWVNGGHWSTCEARMILAYYRLRKFEDARRSMQHLVGFAEKFRMDNPLTHQGSEVYQPNQPVNLCYDALGPAAAFMRGLFEYRYTASGLVLVPRLPENIVEVQQRDPVRFGSKQVFVAAQGAGPVTRVKVNGRTWKLFDDNSVFLPYEKTPQVAEVEITLGKTSAKGMPQDRPARSGDEPAYNVNAMPPELASLVPRLERLSRFVSAAQKRKLNAAYETTHALLALRCLAVAQARAAMEKTRGIKPLPEASQKAADQLYLETVRKLYTGFESMMAKKAASSDPKAKELVDLWNHTGVPGKEQPTH